MEKDKIKFIHGTFDILNVKDLDTIEKAHEECETLVVGVYTDELAYATNKKVPIIPCEDRKRVVSAIKGVEYVIEISNMQQLYTKINELETFVRNNIEKDIEQLKRNTKKYKKGFIQGTFDMFHTGHLNLIKRAKLQCEELVVGVNTNDLVKNYKNKTPIMSFEERKRIIGAIEDVDASIGMNDRNKIKAAKDIKFDALIMGSDWQGTEFYNNVERELKPIGVDVVYLPYTQGISSTKLRNKIGKDTNVNGCVE